MRLVVYRGPGHVLRAGARTLYRGEPTSISNELFDRLSRLRNVRLEDLEAAPVSPGPATPDPEPAADKADDTADDGEEESDT